VQGVHGEHGLQRSHADCGASAPVCATSGAAAGRCVQCLATSDCKAGSTCDTASTFMCIECQTDAHCANPTPTCTASKQCAACVTNADCVGSASGPDCAGGSCVPAGSVGGTGGAGGAGADGGAGGGYTPGYGDYQFPNTNKAGCSESPAGAPLGGGIAGIAIAVGAALRRRARRMSSGEVSSLHRPSAWRGSRTMR
jgi:hypothetical protein